MALFYPHYGILWESCWMCLNLNDLTVSVSLEWWELYKDCKGYLSQSSLMSGSWNIATYPVCKHWIDNTYNTYIYIYIPGTCKHTSGVFPSSNLWGFFTTLALPHIWNIPHHCYFIPRYCDAAICIKHGNDSLRLGINNTFWGHTYERPHVCWCMFRHELQYHLFVWGLF